MDLTTFIGEATQEIAVRFPTAFARWKNEFGVVTVEIWAPDHGPIGLREYLSWPPIAIDAAKKGDGHGLFHYAWKKREDERRARRERIAALEAELAKLRAQD